MSVVAFEFGNLAEGHVGVTQAIGAGYEEAARVCLGRRHVPPTKLALEDSGRMTECLLKWALPDERATKAWANENDATEAGAYAPSLAAMHLTRGLVAVSRAETMTGADYYLGRPGEALEDFETAYRLEVSGMRSTRNSDISRRMKLKPTQAMRGSGSLPAIVCIVSFGRPTILARDIG